MLILLNKALKAEKVEMQEMFKDDDDVVVLNPMVAELNNGLENGEDAEEIRECQIAD